MATTRLRGRKVKVCIVLSKVLPSVEIVFMYSLQHTSVSS